MYVEVNDVIIKLGRELDYYIKNTNSYVTIYFLNLYITFIDLQNRIFYLQVHKRVFLKLYNVLHVSLN